MRRRPTGKEEKKSKKTYMALAKLFGRRSNKLLTRAALSVFLLAPSFLVYILHSVLFQRPILIYLFSSIHLLLYFSICSIMEVSWDRGEWASLCQMLSEWKQSARILKLWSLHRKRMKSSQISSERCWTVLQCQTHLIYMK